jgi:hypothetical protein
MTLPRGIVTAVACFALSLGGGGTAQAQTAADSFGSMAGRLAASEKPVRVTTAAEGKISGKLLDLSESSLTVLVGHERRTLQKSEILQVAELHHHAGQGALIGLGTGAALGFVGMLLACGDCGDESGAFALAGAIVYGGIGAGIGALAGAATTTERNVYRAPAPAADARFAVSPLVTTRGAGIAATLRF